MPHHYTMTSYKRKRIEESMEKIDMKSKQQIALPYATVITTMHELCGLIKLYSDNKNNETTNKLKEIYENVPMICFWGNQSSGKSSCLYKMIPQFEKHTICTGIGTLCPIEIKLGPIFENKIYIEFLDRSKASIMCKSITEAENKIKDDIGANICTTVKIVQEINNQNNCFIITDLPGYVTKQEEYFEKIKEIYLSKPNTIIFHTCSATNDPSADFSANYLKNVQNNNVIKVITHTDLWETSPVHINYLDQFIGYKMALVNNTENDIQICEKYQERLSRYDYIKGSRNLLYSMMNFQKGKTIEIMPFIKKTIKNVVGLLELELDKFHRSKPNMRDVSSQFKMRNQEHISKLFQAQNTEYSKNINSLKIILESGKFILDFAMILQNRQNLENNQTLDNVFDKSIGSEDKISDDIKMGSRRHIEGTESCHDILKLYVESLLTKIKDHYISYIDTRFKILLNYVTKTLVNDDDPFSKDVIKELLTKAREYINSIDIDCKENIDELIESKKNNPHVNDHRRLEQELYEDLIRKPILSTIEKIRESRDVEAFFSEIDRNLDLFVSKIAKEHSSENIYKSNARKARKLCKYIWNDSINELNSYVLTITEQYERDVEKYINSEIVNVEHDKFNEPEGIAKKRNLLLKMEEKCNKLLNAEIE